MVAPGEYVMPGLSQFEQVAEGVTRVPLITGVVKLSPDGEGTVGVVVGVNLPQVQPDPAVPLAV